MNTIGLHEILNAKIKCYYLRKWNFRENVEKNGNSICDGKIASVSVFNDSTKD